MGRRGFGDLSRRLLRSITGESILEANVTADMLDEFPERAAGIVKGESHHQDALRKLAKGGLPAVVAVEFRRDPGNRYDRNALAAHVDGMLVGFMAKELAATISPICDGHSLDRFTLAGVIRDGDEAIYVDVWPDRRLTSAPPIKVPSGMLRSADWRGDRITDRQIAFIRNLVEMWNPDADVQYGGASRRRHAEALRVSGLPDLSDRSFRRLTKGDASQIIDRLREWERQQ